MSSPRTMLEVEEGKAFITAAGSGTQLSFGEYELSVLADGSRQNYKYPQGTHLLTD